ncbi:hypothetical protein HYQ46_011089 [Verticillium longisporum]|nr:hypothetical protein HYQ46_011089 [Verticillium longisporum]
MIQEVVRSNQGTRPVSGGRQHDDDPVDHACPIFQGGPATHHAICLGRLNSHKAREARSASRPAVLLLPGRLPGLILGAASEPTDEALFAPMIGAMLRNVKDSLPAVPQHALANSVAETLRDGWRLCVLG